MPRNCSAAVAWLTCAIVASGASVPGTASAMIVTHDEAAFMALWANPNETVDFTHLRDGVTFANANNVVSPYVRQIRQPPLRYMVMQDGWSGHFNLGSTIPGCQCAWQAVEWTSPGIVHADFYGSLYLELLGTAGPVALGSGSTFTGLIPESAADTFYILGAQDSIAMVRLGFSAVTLPPPSVPEPATAALVLVAACAAASRHRRVSASPAEGSAHQ